MRKKKDRIFWAAFDKTGRLKINTIGVPLISKYKSDVTLQLDDVRKVKIVKVKNERR